MTTEQLAYKIDRLDAKVSKLLSLLIPEHQSKWVKAATINRELGLTDNQIRYARLQNPRIARKKASGRFEYDLLAYKKLPV